MLCIWQELPDGSVRPVAPWRSAKSEASLFPLKGYLSDWLDSAPKIGGLPVLSLWWFDGEANAEVKSIFVKAYTKGERRVELHRLGGGWWYFLAMV